MGHRVQRPAGSFAPGKGLLRNEHFQVGYCTNDLGRARSVFAERFGIGDWFHIEGDLPTGGQIEADFAWVGSTMYELLTASGAGSELFMETLPADRFAVQHHHLGFFVQDQAEWDALREEIDRGGWRVRIEHEMPGVLRFCYVEVPELGHHLEYIFPGPEGIAMFEGTPNN